jgi:hypothetical protein
MSLEPHWQAPWFDAIRPMLAALGEDPGAGRWAGCLERLDRMARSRGLRNEQGLALAFVDAATLPDDAYERHIWRTGQVPTRTSGDGAWHDLFNALAWLAYPRTKARLNRLQAQAIERDGVRARRGGLRDAATLFDENAVIVVTANSGLVDALRAFDWHALFVADRDDFVRDVRVHAFGHALVDKLRRPYKAICAHAWVVDPSGAGGADADTLTAGTLDEDTLRVGAFTPLPVLGIPGWWPANRDPGFYDDPLVFRPGRSRHAGPRSGTAR